MGWRENWTVEEIDVIVISRPQVKDSLWIILIRIQMKYNEALRIWNSQSLPRNCRRMQSRTRQRSYLNWSKLARERKYAK